MANDGRPASAPGRLGWADRLRVATVLALVPYHAARIFDAPDFSVEAPAGPGWEVATRLFDVVAMPVLFFVAGIALLHSSRTRGARAFWRERAARLAVPLAFGSLVLLPPVGWAAGVGEKRAKSVTTRAGRDRQQRPQAPRAGLAKPSRSALLQATTRSHREALP